MKISKFASQVIIGFTTVSALPLATAILYLYGTSYYNGYLSYWRLSYEVFPLSIVEGVRHGFLRSSLDYIPVSVSILIAIIISFSVIYGFFVLLEKFKGGRRVKNKKSKGKDENEKKQVSSDEEVKYFVVLVGVFIFSVVTISILVLSITLFFTFLKPFDAGYTNALEGKQCMDKVLVGKECDNQNVRVSPFKPLQSFDTPDQKGLKAYEVVCSAQLCAIYDGKERRIVEVSKMNNRAFIK